MTCSYLVELKLRNESLVFRHHGLEIYHAALDGHCMLCGQNPYGQIDIHSYLIRLWRELNETYLSHAGISISTEEMLCICSLLAVFQVCLSVF